MTKFLSFLSPVATLILALLSFVFLLLLPPLWIPWLLLIAGLIMVNCLGIRYVLGYKGKARPWHHWLNVCECALAGVLLIWAWDCAGC